MIAPRELAKAMEDVCGSSKWIRLPLEARDPLRIARRLEPVACNGGSVIALGVCEGIDCYVCLWSGSYNVRYEKIHVSDVLSGVRHWVRIPVGLVGGRPVWRGIWRGDRFRVERVECFARARIGVLECLEQGIHCEVASRVSKGNGQG